MKITVATPFDSANFGAYLQAYCLKIFLENQGHFVEHIRTRDEEYVKQLYFHVLPKGKKEKLFRKTFERQLQFGKRKYEIFQNAHKYFKVVDSCTNTDLLIVGSDEVWNINKPAFQRSVFWGDITVPTVAYAVSIGDSNIEDFEYYPDQIQQLKTLSSVLVRDKNTYKFAEKFGIVDPKIVCDPTILLPVKSYGEQLEDDFIRENKCLLVYAYRLDKSITRSIKEYAKKHGLKTVSCCFDHKWCDYYCECTPLQFSSLISQCEEVVTTTFHGSIFSFLNHSNFVCIPKSIKSNQVLEQFGLEDRIVSAVDINAEALNRLFRKKINYQVVDSKIDEWRKNSANLLNEAILKSVDYRNDSDDTICFPNNCTGCFACAAVCAKQAISCHTDIQGRSLPIIDTKKCIKCGACKRVCPQREPVDFSAPIVCYAAQRVDEELRKESSSGGIGAILAENFIKDGNVCGAVVSKDKVEHRLITNDEEVDLLRGSKYVQSSLEESFKSIKHRLTNNEKTLFFGTPCQVAAARKLFGNNPGFYCVDLICHGVPPMMYLLKHFDSVINGKTIEDYRFRGTPDDFVMKVKSGGKVVYEKDKNADGYFYAFLKCLTYRENCYNCKYACIRRCGDITIGDFWKLNKKTLSENFEGKISLVLINTEKGKDLFEMIKDAIRYEKRELNEAIIGNPQLHRPSYKHKKRNIFIREYMKTQDFEAALQSAQIQREMRFLNCKRFIYKLITRNDKS